MTHTEQRFHHPKWSSVIKVFSVILVHLELAIQPTPKDIFLGRRHPRRIKEI